MEEIRNNIGLKEKIRAGSGDAANREGDSSISYKIFETKQFLKDFNQIKGKIQLSAYKS
ncbi:MAG TPA: hypothetical protein VK186_14775 [Candidatus Deferrimicrobium sp.]|nr:hypothetical protein [Candidatus Deferrimicrobium sp.]